jgi:lipid-binding SYLF domain-containing protein
MRAGMRRIVGLAIMLTSAAVVVPTDSMALSLDELDRRLLACNLVLKRVLEMPDRGIPKDLLQRCRGLAVFPGVVKAGVVIGVSFGNGVIVRRDENTAEWTRPVFFRIRGASIGFQAGAQFTDLILLVMSEQGVQGLLEDRLILGADVSVAVGPVGREAAAETDMRFSTGILSYSRSKGLFAGVSLSGASLEPDIVANAIYHGKGVTVQDVFYENQGALSDSARVLMQTLEEATR